MKKVNLLCATGIALTSLVQLPAWSKTVSENDWVNISNKNCSSEKLQNTIPASMIGEAVAAVSVDTMTWVEGTDAVPAHCMVEGSIKPVDTSATAQAIHFAVALPAAWNARAIQMGGGGMNGRVPRLTGSATGFRGASELLKGYATYGSDSGHSNDPNWLLNDEAIRNLGYAQMKKTHDAAMVIMEKIYGKKPDYNYYIGNSQGGREALTVAQRYPQDYDGISAGVPIVNFTALMQSPTLVRIQEKKLANWVTHVKGNAIVAEFMRQCDGLDGLNDGVINNYVDCRSLFNVQGKTDLKPWAAKQCPNNRDLNPEDTSENACLTAEQIETLNFVFSTREFAPVANNISRFGMWAPTTAANGKGMGQLFSDKRFKGQEGAEENANVYSTLGVEGVTGIMMQDIDANPLDYDPEGKHQARRLEVSAWLDATNPDFSAFEKRGGKMLVIIGTDDAIASTGAQLDYYQSLLDKAGRDTLDTFARLYVLPQTGHALIGNRYPLTGEGKTQAATPLPANFDRLNLLVNWVEAGVAPGKTEVVTGNIDSGLMCSYPEYTHYKKGEISSAETYQCKKPKSLN